MNLFKIIFLEIIDEEMRLKEENAQEEVIRDQQSRLSKAQQQLITFNKLIRDFQNEIIEKTASIRHEQAELYLQAINAPAMTA